MRNDFTIRRLLANALAIAFFLVAGISGVKANGQKQCLIQ